VLKHVQPHEIPFSTSVTAGISVVKHSNNMKTSYALHVITKYGTIFLTISTATGITQNIKEQQYSSVEAGTTT
jgi:hypothetical protein